MVLKELFTSLQILFSDLATRFIAMGMRHNALRFMPLIKRITYTQKTEMPDVTPLIFDCCSESRDFRIGFRVIIKDKCVTNVNSPTLIICVMRVLQSDHLQCFNEFKLQIDYCFPIFFLHILLSSYIYNK